MYRSGIGEINERIRGIRQLLTHRDSLKGRIARAGDQEMKLSIRIAELRSQLKEEERDVERLEKGVAAFFAQLFGNLDEKLDAERQEVLEVQVAIKAVEDELEAVQGQRASMREGLKKLAEAKASLPKLVEEKKAWIRQNGGTEASELHKIEAELEGLEKERIELWEAVDAGRRAQTALHDMESSLEQMNVAQDGFASSLDIFDGLSSYEASKVHMKRARAALAAFRREAADVGVDVDAIESHVVIDEDRAIKTKIGIVDVALTVIHGHLEGKSNITLSWVNRELGKLEARLVATQNRIKALRSRQDEIIARWG